LARSDGVKVLTNGTAVATPATAPAQLDAINQVRLPWSTGLSLMEILGSGWFRALRCAPKTGEIQGKPGILLALADESLTHRGSATQLHLRRYSRPSPRKGWPTEDHHVPKERKMSFASEFKEFAMKGSVVDLAVGVIIGGAFGKIVDSIVSDLIMPIVGKIFGGLDFTNYFIPLAGQTATNLVDAKKAGAVFAYGNFITVALNFMILAFIIFLMIKQLNRMKKEAPPAPPAPTPEDVVLLREIRDSLKK
jgi:large conductance mechanosensitive channel